MPDMPDTIQFLYMAGNSLEGNIPASMENLTSLVSLDLSFNALSGEVNCPTSS